MKDKKGQALIEFILIIPFLTIIFLIIFDISNVLFNKYVLQNNIDDIVVIYKEDKNKVSNYVKSNDIEVEFYIEDEFIKVVGHKDVKIITPLADSLFPNPYTITIERYIYE